MGSSAGESDTPDAEIENEIAELETRLALAKERLQFKKSKSQPQGKSRVEPPDSSIVSSTNHFLLVLSDSALPLGSFAFSSGLESFLAHSRAASPAHASAASFVAFLPISVASYASTTLPFALAAHRSPSVSSVAGLDDQLDAAIICTVGRRASVAQGRALLSVWERSLAPALPRGRGDALKDFSALLRSAGPSSASSSSPSTWADEPPAVSAHLAPLFGAVANLLGLSARQTAYVFLLGHVKALISAAVRASMFGPFQAQRMLASEFVQDLVAATVEREWHTHPEDAGQSVPVMDLWIGRHELLYSRIFNS